MLVSILMFSVGAVGGSDPGTTISIADTVVGPVNPGLLGQNSLGHDPCSRSTDPACKNWGSESNYGSGQWDPVQKRPNDALVSMAQQVATYALRFPGGCGTHRYDWKKTIGPVESRPMFQFGLDEFLTLCRSVGAKPVITVSYYGATDADLADLVAYLNSPVGRVTGSGGIDWAAERAKNGHLEPYGVEFFELGNEEWHGDHVTAGSLSPRAYVTRFRTALAAMKAVDATIKLGAVLRGQVSGWDDTLVQNLAGTMDYGVVHVYPVSYWSDGGEISAEDIYRRSFAGPSQAIARIVALEDALTRVAGRTVPLAITEYNQQFLQEKPVPYRHVLGTALLNADTLMRLMTSKLPLLFVNHWHFSNAYWGMVYNTAFKTGAGRYRKRPNWYVYELLAGHLRGHLVQTTVSGAAFAAEGFTTVDPTFSTVFQDSPGATYPKVVRQITPDLWTTTPVDGVSVKREGDEVVVTFSGGDVQYYHTSRTETVNPRHRYRVSAEVKAEGLTSTNGFGLEVQDLRGYRITQWARSADTVGGTTGWERTAVEFSPLGDASGSKIMLRRIAGGGSIQGKARVRNVLLEDLGPRTDAAPTPFISAVASQKAGENSLTLLVVNRDLTARQAAKVVLSSRRATGRLRYWVLNGSGVGAHNEGSVDAVTLKQGTSEVIAGAGTFNYTFEPHSVTVIEVDLLPSGPVPSGPSGVTLRPG